MSMSTLQADKGEKARIEKAIDDARMIFAKSDSTDFALVAAILEPFEKLLGEQVEAREQTEGAWIRTNERLPTGNDSDVHGEVIWRNADGSVFTEKWDDALALMCPHWLPIPPLPAGAPEKKEERK